MGIQIRTDCFAYETRAGEHCSALDKLYCKEDSECSFYCHKDNFDKNAMLKAKQKYSETHKDTTPEITLKEIMEVLNED